MIYLLKFGASFVLPPGSFFVLLWGVAFWCWRRRERRIAAALAGITLAFYLLSTAFVAEPLMRSLTRGISSIKTYLPQPVAVWE